MSAAVARGDESHLSRNARPKPKPKRDSSSSQTAKKRELDRIAQKKSRERVRNRMLELQEKLERLQSDDKQKQITDLLKVVDDLKKENERLRDTVEKIRGLVNSTNDMSSLSSGSRPKKRDSAPKSTIGTNELQVRSDICNDSRSSMCWDMNSSSESPEAIEIEDHAEPAPLHSDSQINSTFDVFDNPQTNANSYLFLSSLNGLTSFESSLACGTPGQPILLPIKSTVVPDIEKWHTSNNAFVFGIDSGKSSPLQTKSINSSSAYQRILWGCEKSQQTDTEHPFWLALREIDQRVFGDWKSKAQKIAMMFVAHRMLLYQSNPCKETFDRIPTFMRPRPSQERTQHPAVVDFLVWPGLRDRLVFSHKHYTSTGDFSAAFCENLHFHWPFSDDDILIFDEEIQDYKFSPLFEKYAFDLKNWTMDDDFFEKFGEMRYDIPATKCENGLEKLFDYMPMTA
ncbi:uncharacterized protein LY89DRAFT_691433 [Mollisia scopiformis]|uniref:BZIP transcription factor n=1 Tax=Mollisia scopiformis TaxID=149040 RepID=A0A132B5R2_MOLSC|nr:uncharacterized protein LY89DRAFT_691433 [Mollisia scopiformis]KUJ07681.1 hypothetical protein LY89DRAFT_691433 [Mollisia scopiformis]